MFRVDIKDSLLVHNRASRYLMEKYNTVWPVPQFPIAGNNFFDFWRQEFGSELILEGSPAWRDGYTLWPTEQDYLVWVLKWS